MSTRERGLANTGSRAYLLIETLTEGQKTEKGGVWSRDTAKKEENRKSRKKEAKGQNLMELSIRGYL